ncbi:MAG: GNAT family protein [Kofleriaceae bacterium]
MSPASIVLTPLACADVDDILTWVNDDAVVGNLASFAGAPLTRDDELAWIQRTLASTTDCVCSIRAADDGRYLGQIGIHQIHARSRVGRLAVVVARRAEMGRGVGSAAIRAMLDRAFAATDAGGLGLHKVWLMVFASNTRSLGIYRRLGFVDEGIMRQEYVHAGAWHDMARLSVLASEWPPPGADAR